MTFRICLMLIGVCTAQILYSQTIKSDSSEVKFSLSNIGINTVRGSITDMEGTIDFKADDLKASSFNVCVNVNTIQTGIGKRDEDIKKEGFFHASKYPTICFESNSVSKSPTGYETTGTLTLRGVKKEVTIPFTYENNTFKGVFIIYRLDYKVGEDTSTFTAGNEVEIEIICVTE